MLGVVTLLLWNGIINFSDYFNTVIPRSIFNMTMGNSLGGLLSFIVSLNVGSTWRRSRTIWVMLFAVLALSFAIFGFLRLAHKVDLAMAVLVGLGAVAGFVNCWLQAVGTSAAFGVSPRSIQLYNIGQAVCGISVGAFMFLLSKIFDTQPRPGPPDIIAFEYQALAFGAFFLVCFAILAILLVRWTRRPPVGYLDVAPPADPQPEKSDSASRDVLVRSIDANLAIFILLFTTVNLMSFWVYTSYKAFERPGGLPISTFYLSFNIADLLSKMIPLKLLPRSMGWAHLLNLIKTGLHLYFFYIVYTRPEGFLSSEVLRLVVIFVVGFMNGYTVNAVMILCAQRFSKAEDKKKSGFYGVAFLMVGVSSATVLNLFLLE